jgi:hypothetical protein
MKKLFLLALLLAATLLSATTFTSHSLLFSDSYMLRAKGSEANYWNPALLNEDVHDFWFPGLNLGIYAGNNSLNIDLYNFIVTRDSLTLADKQRIMDAIDERIAFNLGSNIGLLGFTMGNVAFSSSVHVGAGLALDEDYLRLLLYGNGDGSETFEFSNDDNYINAQSYLDLTIGVGDIRLPLPETIPDIDFGFSCSLLGGIADAHSENVHGYLSSNLDGLNFSQDATLMTAAAGYGFKGMLGLYSQPIDNLYAGITLDNVFGFIKWGMMREKMTFHAEVDSFYAINLDEDFFNYEVTNTTTEPYTTKLPPELRVAAMFKTPQVSISGDYIQGFGKSVEVSTQPRFSVGAELTPIPLLPIQIGFGSGNDTYPWRVSYGLGLNFKVIEFGIGVQSIESLIPDNSTKGVAVATYFNLRF